MLPAREKKGFCIFQETPILSHLFIIFQSGEAPFLESGGSETLLIDEVIDEVVNSKGACVAPTSFEAFVDATALIDESDENNNILGAYVGDAYPDFEIQDISLDTSNGKVAIEIHNTGEGDAYPENGIVYLALWFDDLEGAPSFISPINQNNPQTAGEADFFIAGQSSTVERGSNFYGQHVFRACIDYSNVDANGIVDELEEGYANGSFGNYTNCFKASTSEGADLLVHDLYVDESTSALVLQLANFGTMDVTSTQAQKAHLSIYLDETDVSKDTPDVDVLLSAIPDQTFLKVDGKSGYIPEAIFTGTHLVKVCVDSTKSIQEINEELEERNCTEVKELMGINVNTSYKTQISYTPTELAQLVRYYSTFLPQGAQQPSDTLVPAEDEYKVEAQFTGSVAVDRTGEDSTVDNFGTATLSSLTVRNELFRRFSELTKGIKPKGGDYTNNLVGMGEDEYGNPVLTASDTLYQLLDKRLFYAIGDTRIYNIEPEDDYEEKTLVVVGGDVFIDVNLNGDVALGIVVFRKDIDGDGILDGGNIYIHPDVTDLKIHAYADGSVLRYDGYLEYPYHLTEDGYTGAQNELMDWDSNEALALIDDSCRDKGTDPRRCVLTNQLYIAGSVMSQNTVGGSDDADDQIDLFLPQDIDPHGNFHLAREYDLKHLSHFVLCWRAVGDDGAPLDTDLDSDTSPYEEDGSADLDDMDNCYRTETRNGEEVEIYKRSENLLGSSNQDNVDIYSASNQPVHFDYFPSPNTLPVLGEVVSPGFSVSF
jgi:hypothetical protein